MTLDVYDEFLLLRVLFMLDMMMILCSNLTCWCVLSCERIFHCDTRKITETCPEAIFTYSLRLLFNLVVISALCDDENFFLFHPDDNFVNLITRRDGNKVEIYTFICSSLHILDVHACVIIWFVMLYFVMNKGLQ